MITTDINRYIINYFMGIMKYITTNINTLIVILIFAFIGLCATLAGVYSVMRSLREEIQFRELFWGITLTLFGFSLFLSGVLVIFGAGQ